jgi:autotransporter-associated beta strand protein
VSNPYDFNRDGAVDAADEAIAAANHSGATPLVLIGVPDVLRVLPEDWTDVGLTLQAGGDGRLHVYRTGSATDAVASRARAVTTSIQIVGRDGAADALTLDLSNGNPVPVGGAVYDGAAGDNSLVIADAANQDMLGMTAGQLTLNGSPLITYSHVSSFSFDLGAGTLDLGGGDLVLGCLTLVSGSIDSGSLAAGAVVVHGGTVWAAMTGAGSLIKTTAGTLLLTNANSYTGGTRVDGGTLVVGHPLGIPHGGLTIGPGATVVLSFDLGQAGVGRIANPSYETAGARNGLSRWSNNVADSPSVTSNSPDPAGVAFAAPVVVVSAPAPVQRESPVVAAAIAGSRSMPKGCPASLCAAVPVLSVPIEVKAHDLVLQAPIHQTGDDLAWVEAVHGAWTRKRSAKKHAGALSAVDQVLASLPG